MCNCFSEYPLHPSLSVTGASACLLPHKHRHLPVKGYKEDGRITTAFDLRVQNNINYLHLVIAVIDRLPHLGSKAAYLQQHLQDKLTEHKIYQNKYCLHLPEILMWIWKAADSKK